MRALSMIHRDGKRELTRLRVNDEQAGEEMEENHGRGTRNPSGKLHNKVSLNRTTANTEWKLEEEEENNKTTHPGLLSMGANSTCKLVHHLNLTLSNLPCRHLNHQKGKRLLFHLLVIDKKKRGRRAGKTCSCKKHSTAAEQGRERETRVGEWESRLTKCDWYSSRPNLHPPWLTQWMNNQLTEGEGGKEAEPRERENERSV